MRCHACSAESHDGSLYCESCGERLPTPFDRPEASGQQDGQQDGQLHNQARAPDSGQAAGAPVSGGPGPLTPGGFSVPPALDMPPYSPQTSIDMPYVPGVIPGEEYGAGGPPSPGPPSPGPPNPGPPFPAGPGRAAAPPSTVWPAAPSGGYPAAGYGWPQHPQPQPGFGPAQAPQLGFPPPYSPSDYSPSGPNATSILFDLVFCGTTLLAILVGAAIIGLMRGAKLSAAVIGIVPVHLVFAVLVLGIYGVGGWLIAGRTPGMIVAGRGGRSGQAGQRSAGAAMLPAGISTIIAAIIAGLLVPLPEAAGGTGPDRGGSTASATSGTAGESPAQDRTRTPSPQVSATAITPDGRSQAYAIDALLTQSSASRTKLRDGINLVDGCSDVQLGLTALQEVGSERESQLAQAQQLEVSGLPGGDAIRSTLVEALTYSLEADRGFVAWALSVVDVGCGRDEAYEAGVAASGSAQAAKKRLVALWNPVATSYGLSTRTESDV